MNIELEIGVIRATLKGDEYEEYGDTEIEDCHAVVIIDKEHYTDVEGIQKFNPNDETFFF